MATLWKKVSAILLDAVVGGVGGDNGGTVVGVFGSVWPCVWAWVGDDGIGLRLLLFSSLSSPPPLVVLSFRCPPALRTRMLPPKHCQQCHPTAAPV